MDQSGLLEHLSEVGAQLQPENLVKLVAVAKLILEAQKQEIDLPVHKMFKQFSEKNR